MSDDYEFRVQVMDKIKQLQLQIDNLYSIVEGLGRWEMIKQVKAEENVRNA